jgi:hypothetical protein
MSHSRLAWPVSTTILTLLLAIDAIGALAAGIDSVSVFPLTGVQYKPVSGYIANFTTSDSNPSVANFGATINWGDGTFDTGTVEAPIIGAAYTVSGTHVYQMSGVYDLLVTIDDVTNEDEEQGFNSVTVSGAPMTVTGASFRVQPNVPFSGVVATVVDPNTNASIINFDAWIDWGDGTGIAPESSITKTGSDSYAISGTHTYTDSKLKIVTITVNDLNDGVSGTGIGYANDVIFAAGFE